MGAACGCEVTGEANKARRSPPRAADAPTIPSPLESHIGFPQSLQAGSTMTLHGGHTHTSAPLGRRGRTLTFSLLMMCHLLSLWFVCGAWIELVSGRPLTKVLLSTVGIALAWAHPWIPLHVVAVPSLHSHRRSAPLLLVGTGSMLLVAAFALGSLCFWELLTVPLAAAIALAYLVPGFWVIGVDIYLRASSSSEVA